MYKLIFDKFPDIEFEIDSVCDDLLKQHILPAKMLISYTYEYVLYVISHWLEEMAENNVMTGSFKIVSENDSFTVDLYNGYPMAERILYNRAGTKSYLVIVPHRDFSINNKFVNESFSKIIEKYLED